MTCITLGSRKMLQFIKHQLFKKIIDIKDSLNL